jgi:hypothetical protein
LPNELNEVRVAVWLLTMAPFGSSNASPLDFFPREGGQETGALRYYRGCFWIEKKTQNTLSIDGLALAPAEIAPLVTGQILEAGGARYSVKIDDVSEVRELAHV